jgi:phage FluMu protein gp41
LVEEPRARPLLALQLADELRHVHVYEHYLRRVGEITAIDEALATVLEAAAAPISTMAETVLAYHVLLENEGLMLQQAFLGWIDCPLFRQINRCTSRDEARHVAFGRLYLGRIGAQLDAEERAAAAATLERQWRQCAPALLRRYAGHLGRRLGRDWLERRWSHHQQTLRELGFSR